MSDLSENARLCLDSLETKPALNTPALIAQNEGIERADAESGLSELLEHGLVRQTADGLEAAAQVGRGGTRAPQVPDQFLLPLKLGVVDDAASVQLGEPFELPDPVVRRRTRFGSAAAQPRSPAIA